MWLKKINDVSRNGTRLRVTRLEETFVVGEVMTEGSHEGKQEMIFMMKLISSAADFPFVFYRRKFPLRHSHCLTKHKC